VSNEKNSVLDGEIRENKGKKGEGKKGLEPEKPAKAHDTNVRLHGKKAESGHETTGVRRPPKNKQGSYGSRKILKKEPPDSSERNWSPRGEDIRNVENGKGTT